MRLFGHPVHAMLVAFPLAFLGLTPLWDSLEWLGVRGAHFAAYFGELAGLAFGVGAVVTGFLDLLRAPKSPAIEALLSWHAGTALTSLCIFAVAFALRSPDHTATIRVVLLEAVGSLGIGLTGWCGGHLVFNHGVAVHGQDSGSTPEDRPRAVDSPP